MLRRDYRPIGAYGWPPPPIREVQARWLRWTLLAVAPLAVVARCSLVISHRAPAPTPGVAARWLRWPCLAGPALAVLARVSFVISHDDPRKPGLSDRAWLTLAAAALLLGALSVHHYARVRPPPPATPPCPTAPGPPGPRGRGCWCPCPSTTTRAAPAGYCGH